MKNNLKFEIVKYSYEISLKMFEEKEGIITEAQKEAFEAGFWACYQSMY